MRRVADAAFVFLLVLAVGLAAWLSVRWQARWDWSHGARASLSSASRAALDALPGPLEVTSYARTGGELRATIAAFVDRYRVHKPDLALRFVDPDADPGAMRARGIALDGELELRWRDRTERLTRLDEQSFSNALRRLSRPRERLLAFLAGSGERDPAGDANHDLGRFAAVLAEQGVRAVAVDPARSALPANADLVVLASPRVAPAAATVDALVAWVEAGGNLLWLAEPGDDDGLGALAAALGVRALPGTVVDGAGQALGIDDPRFVAVSQWPPHALTRDFDLTVLLPQARAFAAGGGSFAPTPVLRSGERSWTETGAIAERVAYDAEDEFPGPLDLGLALTRLSPRPDRGEQRVVVLGDGDFLANAWLGNGGNREFGVRVIDWLLGDEDTLRLTPPAAPDRELALSPRALALLGGAWLLGLPLALAGTGLLIAWRRRRR